MNEVTTENKSKGNGLMIAVVIAIVAALAIGGYFFYKNNMGDNAAEGAVATVDGVEITRADHDRRAAQLTNVYTSQGIDTSSAEAANAIREQALTTLINRQLVLNAATEAGTTVSDDTVETEYQTLVSSMGGEANLSAAITATGVSLDQFR